MGELKLSAHDLPSLNLHEITLHLRKVGISKLQRMQGLLQRLEFKNRQSKVTKSENVQKVMVFSIILRSVTQESLPFFVVFTRDLYRGISNYTKGD